MHICIDLTSLNDNLSGIERYAACISLEMIRTSDNRYTLIFKKEVHFLFRKACEQNNVNVVVLPECNKLLFNQIRLPVAISKIKADWYLFLAFPVPILLFKKNIVETIHDITAWDCPETMNGMSKWYFRISHKVAIKKCRAIVTISEFSKKRIHEKLKYPNEKIWLIYCGIDKNQFIAYEERFKLVRKKYKLPDKYILSLSTLEPRKNLSLLIHAYEELVSEGKDVLPLVLAGRKGWKMDELLVSMDNRVKNKLFFTGFIDDNDLSDVYAVAEFFVFPSIYEGFGIPPLEAMACGTPVISSNAASMPEVLGDAALFFESNDSYSLAQKMEEAFTMSEDDKISLIHHGLLQVKKYSWEVEAMKILEKLNKEE